MLYLYKNITPNKESYHYYCDSYDTYLTLIGNSGLNLIGEIEEKNYLIENENILRLNGNNYNDLSYVVWLNNGVYRFYFVNNQTFVSGYSLFEMSRDYWADFMLTMGANIEFSTVTRATLPGSARDKGCGIIDLPQTPIGSPSYTQQDLFDNENVLIFFNVEYSYSKTTLYTNESLTTNKLVFIKSSIAKMLENVANISNVFSLQKTGEITTHEAGVTGIWVVPYPKDLSSLPIGDTFNAMYKFVDTNGTIKESGLACGTMNKSRLELDIKLTQLGTSSKYYFGTKDNYLDVIVDNKREARLRFVVLLNSSNISCSLYQGENSIDLTDEFAFNTVTNNGTFTQQEQVALTLKNVFGAVSGLINTGAGVYAGNVPQFITGAGQTLESINSIFEKRRGKVNYKNADGLNTWLPSIVELLDDVRTYKGNPLYIIFYNVIERYDFAKIGFKTRFVVDGQDLFTLIPSSYVGFIQADVRFKGMPIDVQDYLRNKFLSGIQILHY